MPHAQSDTQIFSDKNSKRVQLACIGGYNADLPPARTVLGRPEIEVQLGVA